MSAIKPKHKKIKPEIIKSIESINKGSFDPIARLKNNFCRVRYNAIKKPIANEINPVPPKIYNGLVE